MGLDEMEAFDPAYPQVLLLVCRWYEKESEVASIMVNLYPTYYNCTSKTALQPLLMLVFLTFLHTEGTLPVQSCLGMLNRPIFQRSPH